ncbi:MAG: response regulator transcription factor [Bacteroidota bacterium]|jgi:DNA-binding NarL/FixJ family response regulator
MAKVKLLIADDHQLFLDGIISLLRTEKDFDIVSTASNGEEVLLRVAESKPDVCILDINMPVMNGMDAARRIRERHECIKLIMLTTHNDREFISEMLMAGVSGYVLKNTTSTELIKAIKKVVSGGQYYSDEVQESIMSNYVDKMKSEQRPSPKIVLTPREVEIVKLLAKEYTNEKIADALFISYRTVETHRKNIMQKTGAKNLAGLLKFAYENKLI